ncbi:glycosyltransferase [Pseudonocardia sp.]|jgi:phosphatidylinositol alpha 1,6-mannosyltransferase|uniref:glycosyltransferase n=1 Tax=Pseudonocardia sp. TaxID=60912 RepID=UPI0026122788|nr:glycosyltransferase [Pseudonocardia sp.]MCW2721968.1 glycosyl transferase group 1 [Pseudonocardia sp.]MDT7614997.1 phosphatidylinositol alpha 1,6-mannosyltransferase [Pseudonocardiales bacterium]
MPRSGKPLRILIGAETYPPDVNGAARFAERLAIGLAGRGHEIHVVAPSPTGPPSKTVTDGVTVHGVRSHRYFMRSDFQVCMPWECLPATAALLEEIDPDVVHSQAHMVVGRGIVNAASRTGRPLVATNHFMPENLAAHAPIPRPLQRIGYRIAWRDLGRVFGKADAVTAPTPRAVELLQSAAGLRDAFPVSCGIDAERYHAAPEEPGAVPTVLFVGRMDQEKRVDELIRAMAALPAHVPAALELVGDGPERGTWTGLVESLGIGHRVRFRGFVSEDELLEAYAHASVFCMPGIAELQSLATLEAMASGTPVVAADAMALPHLVRPGRNGWLYTPGDVPELTTRLTALLADPALRRRMGHASLDIVAEHAIGATLDTFEDLYRRLADRRRVELRRAA